MSVVVVMVLAISVIVAVLGIVMSRLAVVGVVLEDISFSEICACIFSR